MNILDVSTDNGDVTVREDDLASVSNAELKKAGINMTVAELRERFAQGVKLMQEQKVTAEDRIRPVAAQKLDGDWQVTLVRYSKVIPPD